MRRSFQPFRSILFLGPIIITVFGCGKTPTAELPPKAPVKVDHIGGVILPEWTELLGTTQVLPDRVARITSPIQGQVVLVMGSKGGKPLVEGQEIKPGDVIAQLDDAPTRLQAEFDTKKAEIERDRLKNLSSTASATNKDLLVSPVELRMAELALDAARNKQQSLEKLYKITTPIPGRLGLLQIAPGQAIAPGTPIAEVIGELDKIDVLCFVPPRTRARLTLDKPAKMVLTKSSNGSLQPSSDRPGNPTEATVLEGTVKFIAQQADPSTGNFPVKVRFANPHGDKLRTNMVVRIQVQVEEPSFRLMISEDAVLDDQDPPSVVIIQKEHTQQNPETKKDERVGTARKLRAQVGIRHRGPKEVDVEIIRLFDIDPDKKNAETTFVFDKDTLFVVKGAQGLRDGDEVRIEEEEEEEK